MSPSLSMRLMKLSGKTEDRVPGCCQRTSASHANDTASQDIDLRLIVCSTN